MDNQGKEDFSSKEMTSTQEEAQLDLRLMITQVPSMMGLIRSANGNRGDVYDLLTQPTTRTISGANGQNTTVTYPKNYDPK